MGPGSSGGTLHVEPQCLKEALEPRRQSRGPSSSGIVLGVDTQGLGLALEPLGQSSGPRYTHSLRAKAVDWRQAGAAWAWLCGLTAVQAPHRYLWYLLN